MYLAVSESLPSGGRPYAYSLVFCFGSVVQMS